MLMLSEVLIAYPDLEHFEDLLQAIQHVAVNTGEIHLKIDVKPNYPDTPDNWEDRIEGAFAGIHSVTK